MTCNATGREYPPEELDWFKNGNKMETNFAKKIYIRKMVSINSKTIISVLHINKADLADAGTYVCRTSDKQVTSRKVEVLNGELTSRQSLLTSSYYFLNSWFMLSCIVKVYYHAMYLSASISLFEVRYLDVAPW